MRMVILTGAGISAESGLKTFRDSDGLWEGHDIHEVATPEAFAHNPALVQRFYDERRAQLKTVEPNAAHHAIARLQREYPGTVTLITQNVDDLHERAGSPSVIHMHGELFSAWCTGCNARMRWTLGLSGQPPCPRCNQPRLRPDIVWFGEIPYYQDEIHEALANVELFAAIGTSGVVYPAAGYGQAARLHGAQTALLNLDAGVDNAYFDEVHAGPATEIVPAWVQELLSR